MMIIVRVRLSEVEALIYEASTSLSLTKITYLSVSYFLNHFWFFIKLIP
ncbi:hypothetical protein CCAN12_640034 [Capnocytophaga canimorsus]|uniref:Uncharacterized protein n=1 Tax=Capnocytophaga canimorsus TaxID=28188 RepID=A0A0B7HEP9_9FLAO|nr:hypothetical protein CCAN12_640034 [Capnocytophaga canimorsus]